MDALSDISIIVNKYYFSAVMLYKFSPFYADRIRHDDDRSAGRHRPVRRLGQILNANSFKKQGFSYVIEEETLNDTLLLDSVKQVYKNRQLYIDAMEQSGQMDSIQTILNLIKAHTK